MTRALLLTPSRGCGGGVERYAETVDWALRSQGVECHRIDLKGRGPAAHAQILAQSREHLRASDVPTRLLVAHPALLPVASLLANERANCGISVLCHGIDVWGRGPRIRGWLEAVLMHGPRVRVIAVSSFTAGVLSKTRMSGVLPPGLSQGWYDTLVGASRTVREPNPGIVLVTVFRLADWRDKGLPELLRAVADLDRRDIRVVVCGCGGAPTELRQMLARYDWCTLLIGLSDHDLALQLAAADLLILATRTRRGRRPYGEGFGMVLLEAQVAGTPVVAPAYGGSSDAFMDHVTGIAPADESADALRNILGWLLKDPAQLEYMGRRAADWARQCFAPETYAQRAVKALM
jgi:phosphatidylinositol alpha-1,6-mannosyltransferase